MTRDKKHNRITGGIQKKNFTFLLDPKLVEMLKEEAIEDDRSASSMLGIILHKHFEKKNSEDGKG